MADVTETGQWVGHQTRTLRQVRNSYTPFQEGDVLFAKITPCMENGKGCHAQHLVNQIGFGTTEFHVLRARRIADARFIYHLTRLVGLRRRAEAMMTGSAGQQRVPADFFTQFLVPLLPIPEQRQIAAILDSIDAVITQTEALIAKLKQMKVGLMHDLLTRGLDAHGQLRDPAAHPEQFKDTLVGQIPQDWEVYTLSTVVPRAEYGISVSLEDQEGIPVLRMNNLKDGEVGLADLKWSASPEAARLLLRPLDVLFNRTNSMEHVGRTAIWRGQMAEASFASYLVRLVPDRSRLIPEYLNIWLNLEATQRLIRRYATPGVHQVNINPTNLRKVSLALPKSTVEQQTIVDKIDSHNARIRAEESYRDKLQQLKQGLMADLLTGRVRVMANGQEPA